MSITDDSNPNGHAADGGEAARRVLSSLEGMRQHEAADDAPPVEPSTDTDVPSAASTDEQNLKAKHDEQRHPEDPRGAIEDAAGEVCDPEEIRRRAARLGVSLQALPKHIFDRLIEQHYRGTRGVRAGAIEGPAVAEAAEPLKIVERTDDDMAKILFDGWADAKEAERLTTEVLPRMEQAVVDRNAEKQVAEQERSVAEQAVTGARPADGTVERHRMDFWGLVAIMPWLAPLLFVIDATVTTINLQPEVANLFVGVSQVTSYVIAFGVSATMIGASAMAGFALAAIRLSGRAAGLLFVVLFGLIMFKLTAGLDAIRMGSSSGVGTLTAATLAACFVAGLTGYAAAAFRDLKGQRS